ncbi:MAG: hypothetical protein ABSD75_08190 [Terriglobales bacterium]|jgi:hypothetical protein
MSTTPHAFPRSPLGPDVLGELLHSVSQPLTSLRCSLELSLELSSVQATEQQLENVALALQQTEKVIDVIQLMREYLDAEQPPKRAFSSLLAPVLKRMIEELSSIAATRAVELKLVGSCTASLPLPEVRLRLALQYLLTAVMDAQPAGASVTFRLTEEPAATVLRGEGDGGWQARQRPQNGPGFDLGRDRSRAASARTLGRVRLAIAGRVLEAAGASLLLSEDESDPAAGPTGFVLRVPRPSSSATP